MARTVRRKLIQIFLIPQMNLVCRKQIHLYFCRRQWGKGGGGGLDYAPFWGPGHLDWTKLAHAKLDHVSYKIRL